MKTMTVFQAAQIDTFDASTLAILTEFPSNVLVELVDVKELANVIALSHIKNFSEAKSALNCEEFNLWQSMATVEPLTQPWDQIKVVVLYLEMFDSPILLIEKE